MDSKQHQCIFQAYESGDGRMYTFMDFTGMDSLGADRLAKIMKNTDNGTGY